MDSKKIINDINKDIESVSDIKSLNEVRNNYLGKSGVITLLRADIKNIKPEDKKEYGMKVNELFNYFNEVYGKKLDSINDAILNEKLVSEKIDVTLPGIRLNNGGGYHPITKVKNELEDLFISMGYDVVTGSELEDDLHCFEMLNIPKDHPARDTQDTFYISDELLLRTQTSAVQARFMEDVKNHKPFKIVAPGKTYRRDNDDATHSHQFYQMEGLVIGEDISLADLKGTLLEFAKKMFGEERTVRFRPSFFPFTEPSYEVDISCFKCGGKVSKQDG